MRRLVLVGPVGVKTGPVDRLDIPDIFAMPQGELEKLLFHDPERMRVDPSRLTDEQLAISARNRETLALLVWEPYMHNPKLRHRLHRVTAPALFLRGESDGLVSAEYLAAYARLLPNARTDHDRRGRPRAACRAARGIRAQRCWQFLEAGAV